MSDQSASGETTGQAPATSQEPATPPEEAAVETDELREGLLEKLGGALGDALVGSHIRPGDDLWVRVSREAWQEAGLVLRDRLGCRYFCFLSAIDWLPSPYGRYLDAEVDKVLAGDSANEAGGTWDASSSYAGGAERFQVFARVTNLREHFGITIKSDVPEDDPRIDTWVPNYHGANWHERECWEMFGITFEGHPFLRHLYLPGEFEGYPLRKDFPLLARVVKPWPGIVDVEPLPGEGEESEGEGQEGEGESQGSGQEDGS